MDIKTPADWWAELDAHWANLLTCAFNSGASLGRPNYQYQELADLRPFAAFLEEAKQRRDWEVLNRFLQHVWAAAPDDGRIHRWPSWGVLCDLCSETWVFEPAGGPEVLST